MTPLKLMWRGEDVQPIRAALAANPQLWDRDPGRTNYEESPHYKLSDIWVRFGDVQTMRLEEPHESYWYPAAAHLAPVKDMAFSLMSKVRGTRLGAVLITRIRPGQLCKPHTDDWWHSRYYQQFAVQIEAAPGQTFHFKGHSLETAPGDVYWFDNIHEHWVTNDSQQDRVTLIACIRTEVN